MAALPAETKKAAELAELEGLAESSVLAWLMERYRLRSLEPVVELSTRIPHKSVRRV